MDGIIYMSQINERKLKYYKFFMQNYKDGTI
jgi:hypothetical protein